MEKSKQSRILEIFFRALRGEDISVHRLAECYGVSVKSITRSINDIKAFLADNRELVGNTELRYSYSDKCYRLHMDGFLTNKEMFALVEVMIGARAFSKVELLALTDKLLEFTTSEDRVRLRRLVENELYHYAEVKHDCESATDRLWQLIACISDRHEITIEYYKMDRSWVTHRLRPAAVIFMDYYFYLIAFKTDGNAEKPIYFRVDRIKHLTEHCKRYDLSELHGFDEGFLRSRSLFMWPGKLRTVRFEFTGPSVQAVLDKLPTARIIERSESKYLIEAETYGDGIKMWLLSQNSWVKVISPKDFADDMKKEITKMLSLYE